MKISFEFFLEMMILIYFSDHNPQYGLHQGCSTNDNLVYLMEFFLLLLEIFGEASICLGYIKSFSHILPQSFKFLHTLVWISNHFLPATSSRMSFLSILLLL